MNAQYAHINTYVYYNCVNINLKCFYSNQNLMESTDWISSGVLKEGGGIDNIYIDNI